MQNIQTNKMILTALLMAMITLLILIFPIPVPAVNGYINLGDSVIFIAVVLLGWRCGALAGGIGAAFADLLLGYAVWAPFTFIIKGGMALIIGLILQHAKHRKRIVCFLAMACGGIWMALGYFLTGGLLYGNFLAAAISVPLDCIQFITGAVLATAALDALNKTPLHRHFTYRFFE